MPQRVICHECGDVLYEGVEIKAPDEIISEYDGKCPNCRKTLSSIPKNFEVKPVEKTKQPSPFEPEKKRPSRKKSPNRQRDARRKALVGEMIP